MLHQPVVGSRLPEPEFNQDKEEIHQFDETIIPPSPSPHHTDMIYLPRQKKARLLICISQLFSELSEWIWQFSTVVWLTSLGSSSSLGSSLFLNSSYSGTTQIFVFLLVPRVTKYTNSSSESLNRNSFISYVILSQIPFILSATLLFSREMGNLSVPAIDGEDGNLLVSTMSQMIHLTKQ